MKRLYVSDLDGTLLNDKGFLNDKQKDKLNELIGKGVLFTVASARSIASIQQILKDVQLELPVISMNGAYVADFYSGKYERVVSIEMPDLFHKLLKHGGLVSTNNHGVHQLMQFGPVTEGCQTYLDDRSRRFSDKVQTIEELPKNMKIISYTLIGEGTQLNSLKEEIACINHLEVDLWEDMYYKPWYWMSIHSDQATKGFAIDYLINKLAVDEVVVFGDNTNDLEMFKYADYGIAVENAVPQLKAIADEIIGHHNLSSVISKICDMEGIKS